MNPKQNEQYQPRLAPTVLDSVDQWRSNQPDALDRDEAIRRLLELGISNSPGARSHKPTIRPKAADMARETIDRHADQSATSEEQESRKRQLLNGPAEFRDLRRDHPVRKC